MTRIVERGSGVVVKRFERSVVVERLEWGSGCDGRVHDTSPQILALARRLMKQRKLNPRDALHVACAQHGGCDFFITCDDALIQRAARGGRPSVLQLQVVNPVEFILNEGSRHGKG